ncbi:MAG: aspartate-semialdehyde dehydrogenase [Myxococcota bacterium]
MRCALVGATGIAGQQFLSALRAHPFITVSRLAASERSAGKRLARAVTLPDDRLAWYADDETLQVYGDMEVVDGRSLDLSGIDVVFSAIESDAARTLEAQYAATTPVISTASAFRYEDDVPLIIPAINGEHAGLIETQRSSRGWSGFVVPIPNCTTTGLAIAIAPLHRAFGAEKVVVTSMQAVSGAGRTPGVLALDVVDNVVPYIKGEEAKVERETRKLLGSPGTPAEVAVSATCTRVPVLEGHTESVVASFARPCPPEEARKALEAFGREVNPGTHPSAPERWVTVLDQADRPQVRLDRERDGGMTTTLGRLREDEVLGAHGLRFVLVSHNTKMGAAKGAVLVAEDLAARGLL